MPLIEPVIRPPSEAGSFLLQVTVGCSANSCTFCGAYNTKRYRIKEREEIFSDIAEMARLAPETRRVFLLDGDALASGNDVIVPVLDELGRAFPRLSRVGSYANGTNITERSNGELRELAARKLSLIYIGLESGSEAVLEGCRKRSSAAEMVDAVGRAREAGIKSSVIVLLGLGGRNMRDEHVAGTIRALNEMQPRYLAFLSLMLIPGTPLQRQAERGEFETPGARGAAAGDAGHHRRIAPGGDDLPHEPRLELSSPRRPPSCRQGRTSRHPRRRPGGPSSDPARGVARVFSHPVCYLTEEQEAALGAVDGQRLDTLLIPFHKKLNCSRL